MRKSIKVAHVSDTHGYFPNLGSTSMVIHTGDFLPDPPRTGPPIASTFRAFQSKWVETKIQTLKDWLDGRTFILSQGNHDFFDPVPLMVSFGIDAINITNNLQIIQGYSFYGFPYVPMDCHPWNFAISNDHMIQSFDDLASIWSELKDGVDVLAAHCPPANLFDRCPNQNKRFGNGRLNDFLEYKVTKSPKMVLCGHIHGDNGIKREFNTVVSQAACTVNFLGLNDD